VVEGRQGSAAAPLVLRSLPGAEGRASFSSGLLQGGVALALRTSEFVHLYDLHLVGSQTGLDITGSAHVRVEGLLVEELGQAAVHIGRGSPTGPDKGLGGQPSHHIDLIGNFIRRTGRVSARFGEGVYVGTGGQTGDESHDVLIAYNQISETAAEGIDVKAYTYNIRLRGNLVAGGSHYFHAAITLGVSPRPCSSARAARPCVEEPDYRDGHYLVEDNRVFGFRRVPSPDGKQYSDGVAGIGIGHGSALVRNNIIWDIPDGSGIRTYSTFGQPAARELRVEHNTVWNPGGRSLAWHLGDEGTGLVDGLAELRLRGNLTHDGAEGSVQGLPGSFVGPINGEADAGGGPGSGFELRELR
jgi:hypothetical protein